MNLRERLLEDQKGAMRAGDDSRRDALRLLRSAISYAEIDAGHLLNDEEIVAVIGKQVNQVRESIVEFQKGHRQDLVAKAEQELSVLQGYLPQQLSPAELEAEVRAVIAEVSAQSPRDMGKVMGKLMPRVRGKADGREVNAIVSRLLAGAG